MIELYGVEGLTQAITDYHSTPEQNLYMATTGNAHVTITLDYIAIIPDGQNPYDAPSSFIITTLPDGRNGWIIAQGPIPNSGGRSYFITAEGGSFYWKDAGLYDLDYDYQWWPAFSPLYSAGTFVTSPIVSGLEEFHYNAVNIVPFINLFLSLIPNDLSTRVLPWWTEPGYGEPWSSYEIFVRVGIVYRANSYLPAVELIKLDFPSWASVPTWFHYACLIKATGETEGKQIAAFVDPPLPPTTKTLPANRSLALEIWRQDPAILTDEIYNYFPRHLLQYTNLIDEFPDFPEDFEPTEPPAGIPPDTVTPIVFYGWGVEPATDHQFSDAQLTALVTDPETGEMIFDPDPDNGDIMPDSIRVKEIHAALEANRYGVHSDPEKQNLNNIGRLVEAIAYVLGISMNEDGENIPYPDPQYLTPKEVSGLKHLKTSQFAAFDGAKGMQAASIYDIRANIPVKDEFGKTVIQPGGGVKAWNITQWFDQVADDIEAQLGGAALASLQVPAGDGKSYIRYEGLGHAIQDLLFMLSVESKRVDELVIQCARIVHLQQQVLLGLGLPMRPDTIDFLIGVETATKEDPPKAAVAPVASLDPSGPTVTSLFGVVLANLSRLVAGSIGYTGTQLTAAANTNPNFNFQDEAETTPPGAIDL